jgi:hypothetical protein
MPFLVVENRAAGLVALGLDVNALDEVADDANFLGWFRSVEANRQVAYLVSRSLERRWIASDCRGGHIEASRPRVLRFVVMSAAWTSSASHSTLRS